MTQARGSRAESGPAERTVAAILAMLWLSVLLALFGWVGLTGGAAGFGLAAIWDQLRPASRTNHSNPTKSE